MGNGKLTWRLQLDLCAKNVWKLGMGVQVQFEQWGEGGGGRAKRVAGVKHRFRRAIKGCFG